MSTGWPQFTPHDADAKTVTDRFHADVAGHDLRVVAQVAGLTHLEARIPGCNLHWFDVTATPAQVTIHGDMGTFVFARHGAGDQLSLFRGDVNVGHWSTKCVAGKRERFSHDAYVQTVVEAAEDHIAELRDDAESFAEDDMDAPDIEDVIAAYREQVIEELLPGYIWEDSPEEAYQRLCDSTVEGCEFDSADLSLERPTYHLLWCLHALRWAVARLDAMNASQAA